MLNLWFCWMAAGAESWEQQEGLSFDDALTKYVGECGKGQVRFSNGNHKLQLLCSRVCPSAAATSEGWP